MNYIERKSSDGKKIYYSIYQGLGKGQRKALGKKIFTWVNPTEEQKLHNKSIERTLALKEAELTIEEGTHGTNQLPDHKKNGNFFDYYQQFVTKYSTKGKRHLQSSLNEFKKFMEVDSIKAADITEEVCTDFRNYLLKFNGETPLNYFACFKRVMKQATKDKYFKINPSEDVRSKSNPKKKKQLIELDDYRLLNNSICSNPEIKRAGLFSLFTGLRWTDVKSLTWKSIKKDSLKKVQDKTGEEIDVPLVDQALEILGTHKKDGLVFDLPTANGANKVLQSWIDSLGINKHITWHCFRHSTVVILGDLNVPIQVIAAIVGHVNTSTTNNVYTHGTKKAMRKAMNEFSVALKESALNKAEKPVIKTTASINSFESKLKFIEKLESLNFSPEEIKAELQKL